MNRHLRILHLEDDPGDAELVQATLADEGIDFEALVVLTREDFAAHLEQGAIRPYSCRLCAACL